MNEPLSKDLMELLGESDFIRLVESFAGCRCYVPHRTHFEGAHSLAPEVTSAHLDVLDEREQRIFESRNSPGEVVSLKRLAAEFGLSKSGVNSVEQRAIQKLNVAATGQSEKGEDQPSLLVEAVGEHIAKKLIDRYAGVCLRVPLAREIRAVHYRAQGLTNPKIAVRLGMTETGVDKLFRRLRMVTAKKPVAANSNWRKRHAANDAYAAPKRRLIRAAGDE